MRLYDRTEEKKLLEEQQEEEFQSWWDKPYMFAFDKHDWRDSITIENVKRGWLLSLLVKLNLKTPKDALKDLYW